MFFTQSYTFIVVSWRYEIAFFDKWSRLPLLTWFSKYRVTQMVISKKLSNFGPKLLHPKFVCQKCLAILNSDGSNTILSNIERTQTCSSIDDRT